MIARDVRPCLAPKARLRFDRKTNGYLLLYPEKGLALEATAADILLLCTGEHTVATIVDKLAAKYAAPAAQVEPDVIEFLGEMVDRALVRLEP
jgi:pyrroloquinoline quinone biosynthesis protein D